VSISQDLMGGQWEQACRTLTVQSDGWIRGGQIPTAIYKARQASINADGTYTINTAKLLYQALLEVEHECQNYMHRLAQLRRHLGTVTDRVKADIDSGDLPGHQEYEYHPDLDNDSLDERYAILYNLPYSKGTKA